MSQSQKFWTLAEIKQKVERDVATEAELFVEADELTQYINDAIAKAEAIIIRNDPDYFLTKSTLALVEDSEDIDLPSNIYGHKIRAVIYRNGTKTYPLTRVRNFKKFLVYDLERINETSTEYVYFLTNSTSGDPQMTITPPAKESGSYLTMWHVRQANRLSATSDVCDIPEFIQFIFWDVKYMILFKEGHPLMTEAKAERDEWMSHMVTTLEERVVDEDTEIEMDLSHYEESV